MKKLLVAASLVFGTSVVVGAATVPDVTAQATTKKMSASFAKKLKKGTLPDTSAKVGMTYKQLTKVVPKAEEFMGEVYVYKSRGGMSFYLDYDSYGNKTKNNSKVTVIKREYDYMLTQKSIEKYVGKSYRGLTWENQKVKANVYKTGKYYTFISVDKQSKSTNIAVGTKSWIEMVAGVQKLYR